MSNSKSTNNPCVEYLETIITIVGKDCPWRRHWSSLVDLQNTNLEQKRAVSTIPKIIVKSIGKALWAASDQLIGEDVQNTKSPKICNLKHLENNKLQQRISFSLWQTKVLMSQYSKHKPWAKNGDLGTPKNNRKVYREGTLGCLRSFNRWRCAKHKKSKNS